MTNLHIHLPWHFFYNFGVNLHTRHFSRTKNMAILIGIPCQIFNTNLPWHICVCHGNYKPYVAMFFFVNFFYVCSLPWQLEACVATTTTFVLCLFCPIYLEECCHGNYNFRSRSWQFFDLLTLFLPRQN